MATSQVYCLRTIASSTNTAVSQLIPANNQAWATAASLTTPPKMRWAGALRNIILRVPAPGLGTSWTYELFHNGSVAATVTVADTDTEARALAPVAFVSGDSFYWRRSSAGSPTTGQHRLTFELHHTVANVSGYAARGGVLGSTTLRAPMFRPNFSNVVESSAAGHSLVAAAGDVTELWYELSAAPGAGESHTIAATLDGVLQDGTGGTVDTRVVIADLAPVGVWTGTLPVTPGQRASLQAVPSSSPAPATVIAAVTFTATTDGESQFYGALGGPVAETATEYYISSQWTTAPNATETDVDVLAGVTPFTLSHLRAFYFLASPSATLTARRNGATPAGAPAATTSSSQTAYDATGSIAYTDGDTFAIEKSGTSHGLTGVQQVSWAAVQTALAAGPITGSLVAGVTTSVTATRAIAFGLDGATNIHDESGVFKLFGDMALTGYHELVESSAPSAPGGAVKKARIWVEDDGAGKSRLMVQFASGAAQQISVEP